MTFTIRFAEIYKNFEKYLGRKEKEKEKDALRADLAEIVSQGVQWFWIDPNK